MNHEEREAVYGREEYYWGTEPNDLAIEALEHAPDDRDDPTLLDLGAGEGRDAVYFAEQGWTVYAVDVSPAGLEKAERLAGERGVTVETLRADGNDLDVPTSLDVFYSVGAVQYIEPSNRPGQFAQFKTQTKTGGVHVVFAFVDHPEVPTPPDWTDNEHFYGQDELTGYYDDWEVVDSRELVFADDSGDEPHEHAAEVVVARKPSSR
ncbi:SAM-dependent methyltransferase [Haloarchaeobius baliensis]|uniref:SAM-dependent methyltransferase n=1 Tax=Haloarchaeobius baliensis TaxID=1670458 RepID=UPI003F884438